MSTVIMSAVFTYFFMSLSYFYGFEFFWRVKKATRSDSAYREVSVFIYAFIISRGFLVKECHGCFYCLYKFDFRRKVT